MPAREPFEAPRRVYDQGYTEGAQGERAAIVAWLRAMGGVGTCEGLADAIERCDHGAGLRLISCEAVQERLEATVAEVERLRAAIADIDAHSTPLGEDDDGFVTGGYLVTVGAIHRAVAAAGLTAPPCRVCTPTSHDCEVR